MTEKIEDDAIDSKASMSAFGVNLEKTNTDAGETSEKQDEEPEIVEDNKPDDKSKEEEEKEEEKTVEKADEPIEEVPISEGDLAEGMIDILAEKLGLELPADQKKESVDDFVSLVKEIIDANSKPQYSSDDVLKLDDFVKNGGNAREYIKLIGERETFNNLDLSDEKDQEKIVLEDLKEKGFSTEKSRRLIEKYKLDEELEQEAKDALEAINKRIDVQKESKLKEQEKQAKTNREQEELFFNKTSDYVKKMNDFDGVQITSDDKKKIISYIFGVDKATGKTYSQMDFDKDPTGVLVSLAVLRTKGSLNNIDKKAETKAIEKLKKKITLSKSKERYKTEEVKNIKVDPIKAFSMNF